MAIAGLDLAEGMAAVRVRAAVAAVVAGERLAAAEASVTFLSAQRMRALNRRTFGRDRATDVIAFGMRHDGRLVADVYVCPAVARREAKGREVTLREELTRLVVHGVLHAAGWDHPASGAREGSPMWRRQERYVAALRGRQ